MKSEYAEYYRPSDAEFEALWKDSIIAFDASALLNLYFYSEPTAQTVLAVMGLLKDRVWLPHQAGLEYQRNRLGVLAKVAKGYSEAKKTLLSIRSQIHARSQPPFLEDELVKRYDPISDEIIAAFEKAIAAEDARSDNDSVRDQLDALFSARVGKGFTDKELATIYSEGRERYKAKIPPGYKDEKEKSGNDAFGDLVIWKELIEKCKADKKSAILVTDDGKEDWWLIHDDRTIGPRPELLREFQLSAGQPCYLYSSESFLRYAAQSLNASVAPAAIQEVKEVLGPPSVVFRADFNGFESAWESAKVSRKVEGGVSAISRLTELLKSRMHCFSDKERDILLSATYDADVLANTALQPLKSDVFRCGYSNCGAQLVKCHNYAVEAVCNRCCPAPSQSDQQPLLCDCCRFNDTIPDLTVSGNREMWRRLEAAKRRLLYTLDMLSLPYGNEKDGVKPPLKFDFKADTTQKPKWRWSLGKEERVYTGHANGRITINVREADTVEREMARVLFQEAHRTVIGHGPPIVAKMQYVHDLLRNSARPIPASAQEAKR